MRSLKIQAVRSRARFQARRHRSRLPNGFEVEFVPGPIPGPGVEMPSPAAVIAALSAFDPELDWSDARDRIVPLLPRRRPYPAPIPERIGIVLPPGIRVGFGLDLGPAFVHIGEEHMARWGIEPVDLAAVALSNVRRLAAAVPANAVLREPVDGIPVAALQSGKGIASALLLVADCLPRFIGRGPHVLLAPMRDLLVALPPDVDPAFAAWFAAELEAADPNCLDLGLFHHADGSVVQAPLDVRGRPSTLERKMMH